MRKTVGTNTTILLIVLVARPAAGRHSGQRHCLGAGKDAPQAKPGLPK